MPEMTKLVIDREQWYRGLGSGKSRLRRRSDNMMCCLGFYCLTCGASEEAITGVAFPSHLAPAKWQEANEWLGSTRPDDTDHPDCWEQVIAHINDNSEMPNSERETQLTKLFAENNIEVTFIN